MAEDNKPDKGVPVGDVTDVEHVDVSDDDPDDLEDDIDGDDDGDGDDSDSDDIDGDDGDSDDGDDIDGNDPDDQNEINDLLSGNTVSTTALQTVEGEEAKQEETRDFFMPPGEMASVPEDKMVIRMYRPGCYECPHLRPGVPKSKSIGKDQPCLYTKGNKQCPAGFFQLTVISPYEKLTEQLARKMSKAKDAPAKMMVLQEFQAAMVDAPANWMQAGMDKLKQYL